MKITGYSFLAMGIALLSQFAMAQTPGYWHLSDADGLPSNTIYHITENKDGVIYLGTAAGVARFNGFEFVSLENPAAKSSDASDLSNDSMGNIWFSNFNHELFKVNPQNKIVKINNVDQTNFNAQGQFLVDWHNNLWIYNGDKIQCLMPQSNKGITFKFGQQPFSFQLYGKEGLVAGHTNLYRLYFRPDYPNYDTQIYVRLNVKTKINKPIIIYEPARAFITSSVYAAEYAVPEAQILDLNKYPQIKNVLNYGLLTDGTIWVGTTDGFVLFDKNGKIKFNGNVILKGKNTSFVYQDSRNNFWVATLNEGLFMINNFDIQTWNFYDPTVRQNGVTSLFADENDMLLGMQDGAIYKYDKDDNFVKQKVNTQRSVYYMDKVPKTGGYILNFHFFSSLESNGVEVTELSAPRGVIFEDDDIIYSNNSGLRRLKKQAIYGIKKIPDPVELTVETRNEKNIIVATSKQLVTSQILSGRGGRLFKDYAGRIWINSSSGIYALNWKDRILTHFVFSFNKNAMAMDFAGDKEGNIYMAIANDGILQWNSKGVVKKTGVKEGLLSATARRLIIAGNRLWIASAKGLNAIDLNTSKIYDYRISDGIVSNDIQDIAFFSNRIWVATFKGLNSIPLKFISSNPNAPVLKLKSILVHGQDFLSRINELKYLKEDANDVEFRFEAINYKSRNLLYYMYRLLGQTNTWTRLDGSVSHVFFQGLPAGNYTFELRAFNDKGIADNRILKVPFTITEPIWKKAWFWLLCGLLGSFGIFALYRRRQGEKARKVKLENELRISQLASLKAQMNPHFMFNALNSIQDFILLNDKTSANTFLGKFSDLMRLVLDMSNQSHISLAHELKAINLYLELEALRFEDSMEYTLNIDEELDVSDWKIPSMIIQPFVENAIKHGLLHKRSNRKLNIIFKQGNGSMLSVIIEDNGIGRKEAERINNSKGSRHTSFATGATQKRLALLNQNASENIRIKYEDLSDENGAPSGTRVTLSIPMLSANQIINETPEFQ